MEGPLSWLLDIFFRYALPILLLAYAWVRERFRLPLIALPTWRGTVQLAGLAAATANFLLLWSYAPLLKLVGADFQSSESVHGVSFLIGLLGCLAGYLGATIGKGAGRIALALATTLALWFWLGTITLRLF